MFEKREIIEIMTSEDVTPVTPEPSVQGAFSLELSTLSLELILALPTLLTNPTKLTFLTRETRKTR
jgi:hypothetical protein